jgi:metallophosphoesterase (TIGR00282 family)
MTEPLRVMLIGDAVGRPGREAVKKIVGRWREDGRADFVIANGENSAGGKGVTAGTISELLDAGVDLITTGNHVWDNKDVFRFIDSEPHMIRPANYPAAARIPGRGFAVAECRGAGIKVGVINLMGRVFMDALDCPFRAADAIIPEIRRETQIVFVDFHAEATSEKMALGWYLDGRVTCVFGTHTHVPTADERLLHQGTAFVTDIGMTGSFDSVIGVKQEQVLQRFLTALPNRYEVAEKNVRLTGALVTVDPETGKALAIERMSEKP